MVDRATHDRTYRAKHRARILAYQRGRRVERARVVAEAKARPCLDCGGVFPSACMDLDHRNPTLKRFNVGESAARVSLRALLAEIEKCDVVCANCHRIRTFQEEAPSWPDQGPAKGKVADQELLALRRGEMATSA